MNNDPFIEPQHRDDHSRRCRIAAAQSSARYAFPPLRQQPRDQVFLCGHLRACLAVRDSRILGVMHIGLHCSQRGDELAGLFNRNRLISIAVKDPNR